MTSRSAIQRMPAIAVRKGVDLRRAMVESDGDLIRWVDLLVDPRLGIVEEHAQRRRNLPPIDADVARVGPNTTGPAPYVGEHVAVEIPHETLDEDGPTAAQGPFLAARNVLLLRSIQVGSGADIGQPEVAFLLVAKRRCRIIRLLEDIAHASSQSARGVRSRASASMRASKSLAGTL
jgi:hypothetical protein